ncbi:GAP family protein [Kribbella sp. NPDC051770]|uniref:GAP family protein n=1 Tax=Kribbella sp. NPDC051770 TaxID=3155413 RepID=UPI00342256D1
MWPVAGAVFPQAMAIALSPVPLVCIVLVLMSDRPVRAGLAFTAGWFGALTLATGLVAWLTDGVADDNAEATRDGVDVLQLVVGLVFAVLAVRYWRKRPPPDAPPPRPAIVDRIPALSAPALVLAGAGAALANLKNVPLVLSAGSSLGSAALGTGSLIGAVVVFVVVASSTILGPLAAVAVAGARRSAPTLKSLESWLLGNLTTITVVVLTVLATTLIGRSLDLFR